MRTIIYTFSGTGNSLAAARRLAEKLDGDVAIRPIANTASGLTEADADRVGFIFPVYFQSLPNVVRRFIRRLTIQGSPYIFAVATSNGVPGRALFALERILRRKGKNLAAGFALTTPGNSLIVVDYMNPPEIQNERLAQAADRLTAIAEAIRSGQAGSVDGDRSLQSRLQGLGYTAFVRYVYRTPRRFRVSPACTRCGLCARICPAGNIRIDNKIGPRWGADCTNCLACFHWCPQAAIDLKQKMSTQAKDRYHHPEVTSADMFRS